MDRSEEELGKMREGKRREGVVALPVMRSQWRLDGNFLSSVQKGSKTTPPRPTPLHWISLRYGDLVLEDTVALIFAKERHHGGARLPTLEGCSK